MSKQCGDGEEPRARIALSQQEATELFKAVLENDQIAKLLEDFCNSVGIAAAIIDLEGVVLVSARWQRICTAFHRANKQTCARCIESDISLSKNLSEGKEYSIYRCKNGLTDCASPIYIEGQHVANVFIGQFLLQPAKVDFFRAQGREFGFVEEDYLAALKDVPVIGEERLPAVLGFLTGFSRLVGSLSIERIRAEQAEASMRVERAAALQLAQDADDARADLAKHQEELEDLIVERTSRLRSSQQRSRLLLDSVSDGIFGVDTKGCTTFVNPAALRMVGFEQEELLGKSIHDLIHHSHADGSEYEESTCPMHHSFTRGESTSRNDEVLWSRDGSCFPVEYTSVPLEKDGVVVGAVIAFRNIAERKRLENELVAARDVAQEAARAKSDFLANMSHEIRTPMNAVIGLTQLALNTELTNRQRDYLTKIDGAASALLGIINDILDFSKIEANKLELEHTAFDLHRDVLDNVTNVIGMTAAEKGLELLFDFTAALPTNYVGDPLRLSQVLINLLNNAVKFTQAGEIVLRIRAEEASDSRTPLQFEVQDSGIGMSEEQVGRLFKAFSQADSSTTRKHGGTGLGLSICSRLIRLMGGEIGAKSEPGKGSTFSFTVPMEQGTTVVEQLRPTAEALAGQRFLIVDDNPTARIILRRTLEGLGHSVEEVSSGRAAIDRIAAGVAGESVDGVLMDWHMPEMDGLTCIRTISEQLAPSALPKFLLVSAFSAEDLREEAGSLPICSVLTKPVSPSTLNDTILTAFSGRPGVATLRRPSEKEKTLAGARVLVAEDNEVNQQIAAEILRQAGVEVAVASEGQQAVEQLLARPEFFDAVLMDIQMPVLDGYEATLKIREDARFANLPIVAMTANAFASDRAKALASGMNEHIAKPIEVKRLLKVLETLIHLPSDRRVVHKPADDETDTSNALPALAGVDIASGLARLSGNQALYRKLLLEFRESHQEFGRELAAARTLSTAKFAQMVHTLKGLAGNLGAEGIQEAAANLESVDVEDAVAMDLAIAELTGQLNSLFLALNALEEPLPSRDSPNEGQVALGERLARLRELLDEFDATAPIAASELLEATSRHAQSGRFRKLASAVDNFDYRTATTLLNEIEEQLGEA